MALFSSIWKPITIASTTPVASPPNTASNNHIGIMNLFVLSIKS
jgi:hypothetical protein